MARTLEDAVVGLVGATGGLGTEIAAVLNERHALVVRANRDGVGTDVALDLRDAAAGADLVAAADSAHGRLDVVINAAGMAASSASKAAAAAAMESIRREFRRSKVHVCDVRPPHTETGLATRPLTGTAPKMPDGLSPRSVAERIVATIEADEAVVTADQFG